VGSRGPGERLPRDRTDHGRLRERAREPRRLGERAVDVGPGVPLPAGRPRSDRLGGVPCAVDRPEATLDRALDGLACVGPRSLPERAEDRLDVLVRG
jgi:hypothetical protein